MPELLYIPRQQAEEFVSELAQAVEKPSDHALVLHVWGTGGVGKSTLLRRLKAQNQKRVVFVEVSFGVTEGIDNPIKLMKKLYDELERQAPTPTGLQKDLLAKPDSFSVRYDEYFDTLHQLQTQPADGKGAVSDEQIKQVKQLANLGASAAGQFVLPGVAATAMGSVVEATVDAARMALSEKDRIVQLIQQHQTTKKKRALQELMLEPVPKLTQAFAETLRQRSKKQPIALVFDTYEKVPAELDLWLWRSFLGNNNLQADSVRVVVAGRNLLTNQEGWRKLNQDRHILYTLSLGRFDLEQTEKYLHEIGITNPSEVEAIFQETKGLPYYLNWIRDRSLANQPIDFSKGGREVVDLLLQGLDEAAKAKEKKVLQWAACCRWFNRPLIQYLIAQQEPLDDQRDWFDWLEQQHFVEFAQGRCRLDDVARDVFQDSLWSDNPQQFRQTHDVLVNYFQEQASQEVAVDASLPDCYENAQWRSYTTEFLYHVLLAHRSDAQLHLRSHLLVAAYLDKTEMVGDVLDAIKAEIEPNNPEVLASELRQFLDKIRPAVLHSWAVLVEEPINYEYNQESLSLSRTEVDTAWQNCLSQIEQLTGLAKYAALIYKTKRCPNHQKLQRLMDAKTQAELIANNFDPEFSSHFLLWNLGHPLYRLKQYEEAIAICDQALQIKPDYYEAWNNRGVTLGNLGRYEEAIASYDQALQIKPDYHAAWNNRGNALFSLGRYEEAIASYDQALQIKPDYYEAWRSRGNALFSLGRYEEAIASYDQALQIKPDYYEAWRSQGNALFSLGRYEEAIVSYDQALQIKPDYHAAWNNRGNALFNLGRYEEAIASCDQVLQLKPDSHEAWYNKACCHALQGNVELAVSNFQQAIQLNPDECREMAKSDADFDKIRGDGRFQALLGEVG